MTLPFNYIPSNLRVPGFWAEVNNSQANTAIAAQRSLIIGQITSSGAATPNVPLMCMGPQDAITQGGPGSMLALMAAALLMNNPQGEVWYLPLADAGGATAAAGSINFTAAATAAGTLYLYIGGIRIALSLTGSQTAAQIATALAAAVTATPGLPVSAAVDGSITSQVDFTALNAGAAGNDIDIRVNYLGTAGGEVCPAGLAYTIVAMNSGATNPTLTTALANLGTKTFDFIAFPYTDSTSLAAIKTFLSDATGRWSWSEQLYGGYFGAYRSNLSNQVTFGDAQNDQHGSMMGFYDSPTPNWIWAAAYCGASAAALVADPARPLHSLPIFSVLAPPVQSQWTVGNRQTLLNNGMATYTVDDSGQVYIDGSITTYQKNASSQPDNSYLQVNTMYNLAYVLRRLAVIISSKYARMKLAANGTRFAPGSAIVTPNIIKADLIATYQELEFDGNVQGAAAFAAGLIVQQNSDNPNRVDVLFDAILIDQLDIVALLMQFRLSVPAVA